jgi:hypothetical protein
VLFLAIANLLILAVGDEYKYISVFFLTGFVTSFFSKNMMVIMCIAMVITNILQFGTYVEGFEEKNTNKVLPVMTPPTVKEGNTAPKEGHVTPAPVKEGNAAKAKLSSLSEEEAKDLVENMDKMKEIEPLVTAINNLFTKFQ